jgi:hypothetical protein
MSHLSLQLPLCALQVFDEQVLARELIVVWEVVDALPVMQVDLVKFMMNPAAVSAFITKANQLTQASAAAVFQNARLMLPSAMYLLAGVQNAAVQRSSTLVSRRLVSAAHPLSAQKKSHSVSCSVSTQSFLAFKASYIVFFNDERHTIGPLSRGAQARVRNRPRAPAAMLSLVLCLKPWYLTVAGSWAACCWTFAVSSDPHHSAEDAWLAMPGMRRGSLNFSSSERHLA